MKITRCLLDLITPDIWELFELTDLFYKGLPPVAGGVLDQSAAFITGAQMIKSLAAEMAAELAEKANNNGKTKR